MQMHGYEHTTNAEEFFSDAKSVQVIQETEATVFTDDWKDIITLTIPARGDKEYG